MRKLYIPAVVLVTIVLVLVLSGAGSAHAAPQPLGDLHATHVSGTLEYVSWTGPSDFYPDLDKGEFVLPDQVLTWTLHGDLEGSYVMNVEFRYPMSGDDGSYRFLGQATFTGKLKGVRTTWTACVRGSGVLDPAYPFAGEERWVNILTFAANPLSHMWGSIGVQDRFGFNDGSDYFKYVGELFWQTGKRR